MLNITYACQANDQGHEIDPTQVKENRYFAANLVGYTLGYAVAAASEIAIIFFAPEAIPYSFYIKTILGTATSQAIKEKLEGWASEPENRLAGAGYGSSAVWEEWAYPYYYKEYQSCPFVSVASGDFDLIWRFNKNSDYAFQIKITAWVNWGESVYHRSSQTFDYWTLEDRGWTSESITFTVYA